MRRPSQTTLDWTLTQPGVLLRLFGLGLVLGMLTCLGLVFGRMVQVFVSDWKMDYLPFLFILVGVESIVSFYWRTRPRDLQTSQVTYFIAEWVVILLMAKITAYFWHGPGTLLVDVQNLLRGIFNTFFSGEYILSAILVSMAWFFTSQFASDLHELEGIEDLLQRSDEVVISNRGAIRRGLGNRVLVIGLGLVVASAVADQNLPGVILKDVSSSLASEITIVVYFVLGLLLMSLVHFSALRAAWVYERIPIDPQILRRWFVTSFVFLGLVGLVAYVLPTHYSLGLLDTAAYLFSWVITLLLLLVYLISIPIMAIITVLGGLLKLPAGAVGPERLPVMPTMPTPPPDQIPLTDPGPGALIQSIVFWTVLLSVIGYSLLIYFRQNQTLVKNKTRPRGWRLVVGVLAWLRERLSGIQSTTSRAVQSGWERLSQFVRRSAGQENWKYTRLNSLQPQEQVRFYYLALLRRSAEMGITRQPAQTPYEFSQSLEKSLNEMAVIAQSPPKETEAGAPQADEVEVMQDVAALTDAFVEARYSPMEIAPEKAEEAQSHWNRLRRWLAGRGKRTRERGQGNER